MNYEQKYNASLEQAKKEIETCGSMDCEAARLIFRLFPQLHESEDERIILSIVKVIKGIREAVFEYEGVKKADVLAYLEKQKKQKDYRKLYENIAKSKWFKRAYEGKSLGELASSATWKDEQKEQDIPLEESIKAIPTVNYDIEAAAYNYADNFSEKGINYIEIRDAYKAGAYYMELKQKEQKPAEWSEEDEKALEKAIDCVRAWEIDYCDGNNKISERLKSLRPVKQERSDEDDQLIGFIFDLLNSLVWRKDWAMSKEECLERLKSLRPQSHWKPSDEQMNHLWVVVNEAKRKHNISVSGYPTARILESLYDDLKRL